MLYSSRVRGRAEHFAAEDRLIGDRVPQIGQGTDNAVVTPTGVAPGQLDHQVLKLLPDPWTSTGAALLGPVELLGNQLTEPSQNRIWFGHAGNLRQGLAQIASVAKPD